MIIPSVVGQTVIEEPQWEVALELLDMADTLINMAISKKVDDHTLFEIIRRYDEIAAQFDAQLAAGGDLAADWPEMPDLQGVDMFPHLPVVGEE